MAKFIYRMQNILNLQTKLENEAKIQLTMANNALRVEQEKLEKIYRDIEGYEDRIRSFNGGVLDVQELKRCNDAIAVKKIEAKEQKGNVAKAQTGVDRAMKRVQETMLERKTQETLRDKAFEVFKKEVEDAESKEIDQVVSFQYNGRREEGN